MTQGLFNALLGVDELNLEGTKIEFAAFVIAKYKESGGRLMLIKGVPKEIKGSIDVLACVGADLESVDLNGCSNISGKFRGGFFRDQAP